MMSVNFIGPKYFRNSAGFSESVAHIRRIIHLASTTSLYTRKCHRRSNEGELTLKILLKNASDLSLCHPPTDECLGLHPAADACDCQEVVVYSVLMPYYPAFRTSPFPCAHPYRIHTPCKRMLAHQPLSRVRLARRV